VKLNPYPQKKWSVSETSEQKFSIEEIQRVLGFFNRITNDCVYMVDYRKQRLISCKTSNPVIFGYSKDEIVNMGDNFKIYDLILSTDEQKWLTKMDQEAHLIFYSYDDFEKRLALVFSYELIITSKNGEAASLYHRLMPFQLCDNGNMWLALVVVSQNTLTQKTTKACIDNCITGERFDYFDNTFVLSEQSQLTQDEITILRYLANNMQLKSIGNAMGISPSSVDRKKKSAFKKLGVTEPTAAVYRASKMNLI